MDYVRDSAHRIDGRWRDRNYREVDFPDVVMECFAASPPRLTPDEILRWGVRSHQLPRQSDPNMRFGQPPLTLHYEDRFFIDVYVWRDAPTSVHQHSFSGAFCVLSGATLQTVHSFEVTDEVNERLHLGHLRLERHEVLHAGDCQEIRPGPKFIHSSCHLNSPTYTLVVRTPEDAIRSPQFTYLPPHVAYDPFYEPPTLKRRLQILDAVMAMGGSTALELVEEQLEQADFFSTFRMLDLAVRNGVDGRRVHDLIEAARRRHGERLSLAKKSLLEMSRWRQLLALRQIVKQPELRFFLACLTLLPNRASILQAIRAEFPDAHPADKVTEWLRALASPPEPPPSKRGLSYQFDDDSITIIGHLLHGRKRDEILSLMQSESDAVGRTIDLKQVQMSCVVLPKVAFVEPLFV